MIAFEEINYPICPREGRLKFIVNSPFNEEKFRHALLVWGAGVAFANSQTHRQQR
jgi:hypothetical protein